VGDPDHGFPSANPAMFAPPALAYVPRILAAPPRRSRINSALWTVAIVGAALVVSSLERTMSPSGTEPSQRTFVDIPVVEPAGAAGALPLDEAEDFAATYEMHLDARGSYVASGQEIAHAFGAELVWSDFDTPDPTTRCTRNTEKLVKPVAWYCVREPYLVRLNRTSSTMPALLYSPEFVDTVKHELAHLIIHQRCGLSKPAEESAEVEGVTDSYAVLFLGANGDVLGAPRVDSPEYAMTAQTDEVATWIHSGVCWFESSDMLK
jgi:hypothetical protein